MSLRQLDLLRAAKASMSLTTRYQALLEAGKLLPDTQQASCVSLLSQLCDGLSAYQVATEDHTQKAAAYEVCAQPVHYLTTSA